MNTTTEVLIKKNNKYVLIRTLLEFNTPIKRYPKFGVWCYLIDSPLGVYVFDTGPYKKGVLGKRRKKTNNTDTILHALTTYFPGKTVKEILLSHYHFDHSQNAPNLQKKVYSIFGNIPPIRMHASEFEDKRLFRLFRTHINTVYKKAGYSSWLFGPFLNHNEQLIGTDFYVFHSPGHTTGNIALINPKEKIIIGGWWLDTIQKPLVKFTLYRIIDENHKKLQHTIHQLKHYPYAHYYYHPRL